MLSYIARSSVPTSCSSKPSPITVRTCRMPMHRMHRANIAPTATLHQKCEQVALQHAQLQQAFDATTHENAALVDAKLALEAENQKLRDDIDSTQTTLTQVRTLLEQVRALQVCTVLSVVAFRP
jgi:septal ring factor EnvC (AmiA/AmiB activator)